MRPLHSYHITALGRFGTRRLVRDLEGYVPLPGARVDDFSWPHDYRPSEGEWSAILLANEQLTEDAEELAEEWAS